MVSNLHLTFFLPVSREEVSLLSLKANPSSTRTFNLSLSILLCIVPLFHYLFPLPPTPTTHFKYLQILHFYWLLFNYKYTKVSPIPPKNSFLSNCHIKLLPFLTLFFKWKASTGYLSLLSLLSSLSFPLYAILLLLLPLYRNCSCQGNQCPNFLV